MSFSCTESPKDNCLITETNSKNGNVSVPANIVGNTIDILKETYSSAENLQRIGKGVQQVANYWRNEDGSIEDFQKFCIENFIADDDELYLTFQKIEKNFENILGYFNTMQVKLMEPLHLDSDEKNTNIDDIFGAYYPVAHLINDMFENKLAFIVLLNFQVYSLAEKSENMDKWTRRDWAYARLADSFISRPPSNLIAKSAKAQTEADTYISNYNIFMGNLVDENMNKLFPKDMKLNSHWGLRDELKSNYSDKENGIEKQRMIYNVMLKIISQDIPKDIINSAEYLWNPKTNQLYKDNDEIKNYENEGFRRYEYWIKNFKAEQAIDKYSPVYPTYIERAYDEAMELSQKEIEKLFVDFISAPEIKQVGELIKKRIGRNLEPFDIWYDGFKQRSNINEDYLTNITKYKYPNTTAFKNDIPRILMNLGWTSEKSKYISDKIVVDAARGSGHAWGAERKGDVAHLRTRLQKWGMDYKGYNIAMHELGHNVEQTITLYDMDYYMLKGVPSTAFTEAVAFMFQTNDLKILGQNSSTNKAEENAFAALDNCWGAYEIMGVSLVDMYSWQWLYENPDCNIQQFRDAVEQIAKNVWNKYYAPVFGVENSTILAIYSHLISAPMYLANYPVGHLIEFQIEKYCEDKNFANEITRMLESGRVIPQKWMKDAVSSEISGQPTLKAVSNALLLIK